MNIYELIFKTDCGQVCCAFHDDTRASAGIGPNGEYNCFACGAKAHDELGFIMKYFKTDARRAARIQTWLQNLDKYKYTKLDINDEQRKYLQSIGLTDQVIDKFFFQSGVGKLFCKHLDYDYCIGYTWFNNPTLSNYNASVDKYQYQGCVGGLVSPFNVATDCKTIYITEGEKDMLTLRSLGVSNCVAKLGGATTPLFPARYFDNKNIVLIYDCDDYGRNGMITDATALIQKCSATVKTVDLCLNEKEDLNDYFIKYKHTLKDFIDLVKNTKSYVVSPTATQTRVEKFYKSLNKDELNELKNLITKGENTK